MLVLDTAAKKKHTEESLAAYDVVITSYAMVKDSPAQKATQGLPLPSPPVPAPLFPLLHVAVCAASLVSGLCRAVP